MANNFPKILACIKTKATAAVGGVAIDCADLALQSLAQCCETEGVKLSMEVFDSTTSSYTRLKRSDYDSLDKYVEVLKLNMGAISLFDQNKITQKKQVEDLVPGEIILYHLPGNPGFTGHTMIVTANNTVAKEVTVAEGHVGSDPPSQGTYTYAQLPNKFSANPNSKFKGGRGWNWSNIIDNAN
ncbi:hypothetical protein [Synechococcus sp. MIT S9507]|uniref:hypothetical protein n=1 Tax=Synechococcus sp. MIT S9507 TaxID=3082544 RepID=UPI0039B4BD0F